MCCSVASLQLSVLHSSIKVNCISVWLYCIGSLLYNALELQVRIKFGGAKDTTQSFLETLVGLLRSAVAIKSTVDAWDVLQCSKAVVKCRLHQTVEVACSSV